MDYQVTKTSLGNVSFRTLGSGKRKILFFHGFPGSSSQIAMFKNEIQNSDLEVLCFDRPGYNQSIIETKNSLQDTVTIAGELLKMKSWTQFEIIAVSGGTPFAINFALRFPDQVLNVKIICGLGNFKIPEVRKSFSRYSIWALHLLPRISGRWIQKALTVKPSTTKRNILISLFLPASKPDREIFQNGPVLSSLNRALSEALVQNALGPKQDAQVFLLDWSLGASSIKIPMHFWHGDLDHVISSRITEAMFPLFPNSGMTLVKGEGHISLPISHIKKILAHDFK